MKLPETSDLLLPMLKLMANGEEYHLQDISKKLAQAFQFSSTGEIKDRTLDAQFYSRVVGARSYMTQALLLESTRRGISRISARGQELLEENPESLTIKSLTRYPEFMEYLKSSTSENIQDYISSGKIKENGAKNGTNGSNGNGNQSQTAAVKDEVPDLVNGSIPEAEIAGEQADIVNEFANEVTAEDQLDLAEEETEEEFDWGGLDELPAEEEEIEAMELESVEASTASLDTPEENKAIGFEMNEQNTEELDAERSDAKSNGNIKEVSEDVAAHQSNVADPIKPNHNDLTVTTTNIPVVNGESGQFAAGAAPAQPKSQDPATGSPPEQALIPVESRVPQPSRVPQESNDGLVQFLDQLKVVSQLNTAQNQIQVAPQQAQTETLSPGMFTLLAVMRFLENWFQSFWLYLIPFVLMIGAYAASFYILEDEFVSKGVLFVQTETLIDQVASLGDDNVNFFLSPSEQTADEIVELLNTDSFIRLIISQTPTLEAEMSKGDKIVRETIADVRDAIAVNITGSNNVEVAVSWTDQEIAWKTATATMNSYIEWKINSDKRDSFAAREFLENLVPQYRNEYQAAVQGLEEFLIQNPEPFRGERPEIEQLKINQLEVAAQTSFDRFQEASDNLEQVRLDEAIIEGKTIQSYTIVDSPKIPVEEEGGLVRKVVTAAVFVTLGIVLSLLAIILSTLFDRSLRFPIESPSSLGLPVLSSVKRVKNIDQLSGEGA